MSLWNRITTGRAAAEPPVGAVRRERAVTALVTRASFAAHGLDPDWEAVTALTALATATAALPESAFTVPAVHAAAPSTHEYRIDAVTGDDVPTVRYRWHAIPLLIGRYGLTSEEAEGVLTAADATRRDEEARS